MSILNKKQKDNQTSKKNLTSFVFLSLVLILICFFIFLFSISSFEQSKVKAVGNSLKKAFLYPKDSHTTEVSFEASSIQIIHQSKIKKFFPNSSIFQNANGIFVSFDQSSIFQESSEKISPYVYIWIKQIKALLNIQSLKQKYILEVAFFEDIKLSEDYPVYPHLLTKRITTLTEKMNEAGIGNYQIRIQKGNSNKIILSFKPKEVL